MNMMRPEGKRFRGFLGLALALASCAAAAGQSARWSFDGEVPGGPPKDAEVYSGSWSVQAAADAPSPGRVLVQTGKGAFPALALGAASYGDLDFSVEFKALSGREDQAAGLIFRIQDRDNYYILRANALEGSVNLYVWRNGQRRLLKEGPADVKKGKWQTLRATAQGSDLKGYLDGRLVVEATDARFVRGRIGLWTKADSVTWFDDVQVSPLSANR